MSEMFSKYIEYIKNTGGSPKVSWFIDDWEPIGETVLNDMLKAGLIAITKDKYENQRVVLK